MTEPPEPILSPEVEPETDVADLMPPVGLRPRRRRAPALIVAALLVGAGLFLALRGMQQVVARAPATPAPTATAITSAAPASIETPPAPTSQPTPMPTSPPLILEP
jgi:hypothetical protein